MASIFTYDPNPPRVSSPWSTPKSTTPKLDISSITTKSASPKGVSEGFKPQVLSLKDVGITRLEPEPQEGPTEYKLHLLLRPRTSAAASVGVAALYGQDESRNNVRSRSPQLEVGSFTFRSTSTPSFQTRQNRLHHLTTQLLWRLQQSSPFHSSSSANLVLPVLPEATPKLGVPSKPAQLLPGLEESQGALYEIGVADDGIFVGLTEEEMQESLNNIRVMAASLGCYVEMLRKVLVGRFQSPIAQSSSDGLIVEEDLWVVEALVRPDLGSRQENLSTPQTIGGSGQDLFLADQDNVRHSQVEQIRVSLVGASSVGKSTLLGVLTSSEMDNGRGKSRISLLKHRHEVSSGITSSVAQELIGYQKSTYGGVTHGISANDHANIVNYGLSNISSWNEIHSMTGDGRLAFISDSPGLSRFSKSTFRSLISWKPHWTLVCVSATEDPDQETEDLLATGARSREATPMELSFAHLHLCLKLGLPMVITMTKMDLASKGGLRAVLAQVLSILKAAGRKPSILPVSSSTSPLSANRPQRSNSSNTSGQLTPASHQTIDEVDSREVASIVESIKRNMDASIVPIVLVSSVTGIGIGKLHALLQMLPLLSPSAVHAMRTQTNNVRCRAPLTDTTLEQTALFHIDEIFSMPVSKVYSPHDDSNSTDQSVVVCGHLASGNIGIGEELLLGPFESVGGQETGQNLSNEEGLFQARDINPPTHRGIDGTWAMVKVISIRNLRLPVRRLLAGQVATLGIILPHTQAKTSVSLTRARRGMILTSLQVRNPPPVYTSFSAYLSLKDFEDPSSPPLIIGGQAIVYINSIRAPVKVVAMERKHVQDDESMSTPTSTGLDGSRSATSQVVKMEEEEGFFGFESDEVIQPHGDLVHNDHDSPEEVEAAGLNLKIVFTFLRWPETFASGDQILVIPSPSGSFTTSTGVNGSSFPAISLEKLVTGDQWSNHPTVANGLAGFVGNIA